MPSIERRLALDILRALDSGKRTLGELLADPKVDRLAPRDRGFLHELVLGTLRHRGYLDYALSRGMDRGLDRVEPAIRDALRLGAYQVLKLRVADHAAVSESVDLARSVNPKASGFVNAVLRRLAREGAPPVPDPATDPQGWLESEGSLPRWLAVRWLAAWGADTAVARARVFLKPAPVSYRLNPRRADAEDRVREAGLEPQALPLPGAWQATTGRAVDLAREGVLYLQDMGSQLVARLAADEGTVLDACAAPGGKSALLADLHPDARVVAVEISRQRLSTMTALLARWGAANVQCIGGDATKPPFASQRFDSVLLDAPCSGLGTLGRNPDIRWSATVEDITRHATRQRALIAAVARLVKPGGRLVYSACTLEPEETSDVVAAFLAERTDFEPAAPPEWAAPFTEEGHVRVRPERDPADGFFAAVLRRKRDPAGA